MIRRLAYQSKSKGDALVRTDGQAIIASVSDRVHRMRGDLVDPVEYQVVLHDHHPKCVSPIPCIVLDDPMSVDLDP
jgi:hypothetical protein